MEAGAINIGRRVLAGKYVSEEEQRDLYKFWSGVFFILNNPTLETKALEKALAKEREEVRS